MKKILFMGFILIISCTSLSADADKVITVAFDDWPPWKIVEGDSIGGIDAEILRAIEERSDFKFEFIVAPWRRCIEMLKIGEVDMITSFIHNAEREKFTNYITPYYFVDKVRFYSTKKQKLHIEEYKDLYIYRIGGVEGAHYFDKFDQDERMNLELVSHENQLIQMLESGRIDLIVNWETSFDRFLNKTNKLDLIKKYNYDFYEEYLDEKYLDQSALYLALSKKSKNLKFEHELIKIYKELINIGKIDEIISENKYLLKPENSE